MNTFYIIQMLDGRFVHEYVDYFSYCKDMEIAARFESKEEAINWAPSFAPFTIIKFYDK